MATLPFSLKGDSDGMATPPFSLKENDVYIFYYIVPFFYLKENGDGAATLHSKGEW